MNIEKFCEFDYISKNFLPHTPYGKVYKENLKLITDKKKLEKKYSAIDIFDDIRKNKRFDYDKIKYHLKNIPYINTAKEVSDITDLFFYKKFLNNYHSIYKIMNKKTKDFFNIIWKYDETYNLLNIDGYSDTFYISDKYDKRLAELRKSLNDISKKIEEKKKTFFELIKKETQLDIDSDFVIVETQKLNDSFNNFFNVEMYDSSKVVLKPKYPMDYISTIQEKERLIADEKNIENEIVEKLVKEIEKIRADIRLLINSVLDIDIAVSSLELAIKFNLKRPVFNTTRISFKNGYFLPLKDELDTIKIPYTPLNFTFDKRLNVIRGSNMGGKTVALKTLALSQLMAQYGFFVSAERFETLIFDDISSVMVESDIKGLSSFAYEIYQFVNIYNSILDKKVLLIMDEFARTTGVSEATAIVNSILSKFNDMKNIYFFMATHLHSIDRLKSLDILRMKGFDKNSYLKYFDSKTLTDIKEKIKLINKFMDYELIRASNTDYISSDALDISYILGIDKEIYECSKKYMEERNENQETKK